MEQGVVAKPVVETGVGYSFMRKLYVHAFAWILRKLTSRLAGRNEGHDMVVKIPTPGFGSGAVLCNVWKPKIVDQHKDEQPLILMLEGGGFILGHPKAGRANNRQLVEKTGAIIISVDYAKAPRYPYPHALLQCYKVLQWSFSQEAQNQNIYIDPQKIALCGNSAGGNLAAALSLLLSFTAGPCAMYREGLPTRFRQVLQVLLYPSLELSLSYRQRLARTSGEAKSKSLPAWLAVFMEASYLPPSIDRNRIFVTPVNAPVDLVRELDLAPALILTGSADCLKEEGKKYADTLEQAGKTVLFDEYPHGLHGFSIKPRKTGMSMDIYVECWQRVAIELQKAFK